MKVAVKVAMSTFPSEHLPRLSTECHVHLADLSVMTRNDLADEYEQDGGARYGRSDGSHYGGWWPLQGYWPTGGASSDALDLQWRRPGARLNSSFGEEMPVKTPLAGVCHIPGGWCREQTVSHEARRLQRRQQDGSLARGLSYSRPANNWVDRKLNFPPSTGTTNTHQPV
jgi:hypothetical protein